MVIVAARKSLIDLLISRSRSFIYTTALAPASVGAALQALKLLPLLNDRRKKVWEASQQLRDGLIRNGFSILPGESQIVPIMMGDLMSTNNLSAHLSLNGFLAPAIRPPTVPEGQGRIRLSITHEVAQRGLNQLLTVLNQYPIKSKSEDHLVQI